jgi:hypothetical protein
MMERTVMRTWKAIFTATLLASMNAAGQQAADLQPSAQPGRTNEAQIGQPSPPAADTTPPAPSQPEPVQQPGAAPAPITMEEVVDRFIEREHALIRILSSRTPMVETYVQNLTSDPQLGFTPTADHYFLGRIDMGETADWKDYLTEESSRPNRLMSGLQKLYKVQYQPLGFSSMVYADRTDFDRQHYDFRYVRREFLGDVRCLVFDVTPKRDAGKGRFVGRIWVEDQGFNIVRLNGNYSSASRNSAHFRMDSWRLNLIPNYWVPSYIYSEGGLQMESFKAQTRIWAYDVKKSSKDGELAQIRVESVTDRSATAQDASPLQAERLWEQQAEDEVMDSLTNSGLLAADGDVDRILQTVVNNLELTNNLDLAVRTRVLLTAPLETFSVGNTIVISRGLLDVLPDEASLAAILAHELAHIVLGHNIGNKFAFRDEANLTSALARGLAHIVSRHKLGSDYESNDDSTYQDIIFRHSPEEEQAADKEAIELLKNSPYAHRLDNLGLFLKALQLRAPQLTALLATHLGDPLAERGTVNRLSALANQGPALDNTKLDQIAALPLGGRVKVNPWDDTAELLRVAPVAIISARDKMPFEVTPFFPRLTRYGTVPPTAALTTATTKQ